MVPKHARRLAGFNEQILCLYARRCPCVTSAHTWLPVRNSVTGGGSRCADPAPYAKAGAT
jgi:hypothetical protein